ncbi:hypothetical protein [Spirosoma sp. KNUC1025]|uniref:hypothetical protein n=1 Tax=Spirosoma sp. KNUC1025 TaxID=2894082 RepID=UPI0038674623|nr:hypothetical protein LN737_20490 [Spirosoma sp. KNUC1025]
MEQQHPTDPSQWGFISPDGFFQPISSLTTHNLELVSKSMNELQAMLQENIDLEKYEKCAFIRDEINKRMNA